MHTIYPVATPEIRIFVVRTRTTLKDRPAGPAAIFPMTITHKVLAVYAPDVLAAIFPMAITHKVLALYAPDVLAAIFPMTITHKVLAMYAPDVLAAIFPMAITHKVLALCTLAGMMPEHLMSARAARACLVSAPPIAIL